jgi:uncharacterized protein (TIGR00255 family)
VEIRTVNHRFFNPAFKMPGELASLETEVRERLKREFERGHIAVSVRWSDNGRRGGTLQLNVDRAREAMARLRELQTAVGLTGDISLELLSRQMDVLSVDEPETAPIAWAEVEPIVAQAAAECGRCVAAKGHRSPPSCSAGSTRSRSSPTRWKDALRSGWRANGIGCGPR